MRTVLASRFLLVLVLLAAGVASGQGIVVKSGASANLATVDVNGNLKVSEGSSARPTYTATATGLATTAIYSLSVESAAGTGFRVQRVCVNYSLGATAAGTVVTTTINKRSAASSGGTALTNEGTATPAISKHDWNSANFTGIARLTGTLGTIGPLIDSWAFAQTVVAGTTGITPISQICRDYGHNGTQPIIIQAGTANGFSVVVSAGGAGSLAVGGISVMFTQE